MWYQIWAYFRFLSKSTNQHGVHSPFVYSLVTKCFYDPKKYPAYQQWSKAQDNLYNDGSFIEMLDAGAGSRVFSSHRRKVSTIAKNAGTKQKRAYLLNRLVTYFEVKNALELGTSLGLGSLAMKLQNNINLTTVEACPATLKRAQQLFNFAGVNDIVTHQVRFNEFFEQLQPQQTFDLVFLDGHHDGKASLGYVEKIIPFLHEDSIVILDDIHWSKDMEKAWEVLIKDPRVSVSIDTFYWGFLFFRKGQEKEHFVIRA